MNQQSFLYNFLLDPSYKLWRYAALILFFTIISVNQAIVGYKEIIPVMGNKVYWIVLNTILMYMVTVYLFFNLVLRFLSLGQYGRFVLMIILCATLFTAIPNIVYAVYQEDFDLFEEWAIVDNLSAFIIFLLCIPGVVLPVFIRNWLLSDQRLNQLKIKQKSSQIEQLKEQINPASFFKVLHKSGTLVKADPDKASAMLMKLGVLLRYQLYDCNRPQVLLTAEKSFLLNFLELEKMHAIGFDYSITTTGKVDNIFISPSLLLPYVQSVVNAFNGHNETRRIDIEVKNAEEQLSVTLRITGLEHIPRLKEELIKVEERLDTLYKDRYTITVSDQQPDGEIDVDLQLHMK
ncbi:histidine kinase [Parabacteroides sp. PF5-9]|uniref:histidine kinase n=1 Tax=Parabacteroides sp. PF5-9 TaxID=1742404 RepID=UPI0024736514|nr:histidine kinase [Parabacteroides sp. PF5-9]